MSDHVRVLHSASRYYNFGDDEEFDYVDVEGDYLSDSDESDPDNNFEYLDTESDSDT